MFKQLAFIYLKENKLIFFSLCFKDWCYVALPVMMFTKLDRRPLLNLGSQMQELFQTEASTFQIMILVGTVVNSAPW